MILDLLILSLANSLVIIGFYESTQYELSESNGYFSHSEVNPKEKFKYKMLLWFIAYYGDRILGKFWNKPFYACCTCMSSVHSTYVYWGYYMTNPFEDAVFIYPVYILALAGMTTFIANKTYS